MTGIYVSLGRFIFCCACFGRVWCRTLLLYYSVRRLLLANIIHEMVLPASANSSYFS